MGKLKEGAKLPAGIVVKVIEQPDKSLYLVLPNATDELSDEALESVTGGLVNFTPKYLRPSGTTKADCDKEIVNFHDAGYKLIITPGIKFENSIYTAQEKYPDTKFVILDESLHPGNDYSKVKVGQNTVSIHYEIVTPKQCPLDF